ncbi:hypothetical protein QJS10_CPA01g01694 [Acorus calamus]|uniref:Uncharacterized protein n=1 Tax=Acorus calamus TaxID=4465 RepID=A0AAV9FKD7_ACOCL|nr:hypothetical protein QJS10_CPA01g01694 [Acorus calamus]
MMDFKEDVLLSAINEATKNWKIKVQVVQKLPPRISKNQNSKFQTIIFADEQTSDKSDTAYRELLITNEESMENKEPLKQIRDSNNLAIASTSKGKSKILDVDDITTVFKLFHESGDRQDIVYRVKASIAFVCKGKYYQLETIFFFIKNKIDSRS